MKPVTYRILTALAFLSVLGCQTAPSGRVSTPEGSPIALGLVTQMQSTVLDESRTLNVLLPPSYQEGEQSYPVIYLLDGALNEDYHHISGLVQFLTMYQLMPESILVGIANVDRKRDFTHPTTDEELQAEVPTSGGSSAFISFIEEELQPFVQKTYRTKGSRTLIGQSLGALLASEVYLKKPELFDNFLIVSPSLWWDNESLVQQAETLLSHHDSNSRNLFLALGDEGEVMQAGMDQLRAALEGQAFPNLNWEYVAFPEETHATVLHRAVYRGFEFLYGESHPGL